VIPEDIHAPPWRQLEIWDGVGSGVKTPKNLKGRVDGWFISFDSMWIKISI